jgi:hypothetical protein
MDSKHRPDQNYHPTAPSRETNPSKSDGNVPSLSKALNNNIGESIYDQLSYSSI